MAQTSASSPDSSPTISDDKTTIFNTLSTLFENATTPSDFNVSSTTDASTLETTTSQSPDLPASAGHKFPFAIVMIIAIWVLFAFAYMIARWRQKNKAGYVIPRVFVLCSPRTVQFHYELILRIGLPSPDFNPDKHDIDITVLGQTKNEVVPMTRLNTKTLYNEPLITGLSIVVYRLVEMPQLGGLVLRHSGPFKSWIYAYDFTVIDLSTNKEQYFTLNQYIGSLNRFMPLHEVRANNEVVYPIDDVPLPQWTMEDILLFVYTVFNCIMLIVTMMPINCSYKDDIVTVLLAAFGGASIVFFLEWFFYFYIKWNQDRRDFFNDYNSLPCIPNETIMRTLIGIFAAVIGASCIYFLSSINDHKSSIVWLLVVVNSGTLVIGIWNIGRQLDLADNIVGLGLKMRRVETVSVGLKYSELVSDMLTKSGSNSEDGNSTVSVVSRFAPSRIGPRSSVKSYGFDPTGRPLLKFGLSRISTGATPSNQSVMHSIRPDSSLPQPEAGSTLPPQGSLISNASTIQDPNHSMSRERSKSSSRRRRQRAAATTAAAAASRATQSQTHHTPPHHHPANQQPHSVQQQSQPQPQQQSQPHTQQQPRIQTQPQPQPQQVSSKTLEPSSRSASSSVTSPVSPRVSSLPSTSAVVQATKSSVLDRTKKA